MCGSSSIRNCPSANQRRWLVLAAANRKLTHLHTTFGHRCIWNWNAWPSECARMKPKQKWGNWVDVGASRYGEGRRVQNVEEQWRPAAMSICIECRHSFLDKTTTWRWWLVPLMLVPSLALDACSALAKILYPWVVRYTIYTYTAPRFILIFHIFFLSPPSRSRIVFVSLLI